jgi:hypothetical protein
MVDDFEVALANLYFLTPLIYYQKLNKDDALIKKAVAFFKGICDLL